MSSLNKLAIRGIRSFDDKQIAVIEFFSPVTVIVGHNGSGKTTIIECLKYATTGDQPPNTRGGAFIHDPKIANEKEVKAQVKLRFHAANGTRMLAVRNLSVTMKKNAALTMKTLEGILGLADSVEKGGKRGVISTKCAEMDTEIPHLLGVSKSVLENVIFCHQEDSYWPLAEPAALKKKFDDIFEATKYTKALDNIKALRKDRVADLKADKERLDSLKKEKEHSDKLKGRLADLQSGIASKQVEHEQLRKHHEDLALANQRFYEMSQKFRQMYADVEMYETQKAGKMSDLEEAKMNTPEIEGTMEELDAQCNSFDDNIKKKRQARQEQRNKLQDVQDEVSSARKTHMDLINEQGHLAADAKAQEERIVNREKLIHDIASQHDIKGFDITPLEKDKVADFTVRMENLQQDQIREIRDIQAENKQKTDEYNKKSRELSNILEGHKHKRQSNRERITKLQSEVAKLEESVEASQMLETEIENLQLEIKEKQSRMEKTQQEIIDGKYEARITECNAKIKANEELRDKLYDEQKALNLQAESRASVDLKRKDVKAKAQEMKIILQSNDAKVRGFTNKDASAETMERELGNAAIEKEQQVGDLERQLNTAKTKVHDAEMSQSNLQAQLKAKQTELKNLEKQLKDGLDGADSVEDALRETTDDLNKFKDILGVVRGGRQVYDSFLRHGKVKGKCQVCDRKLNEEEFVTFEKSLHKLMQASSREKLEEHEKNVQDRQTDLEMLQDLIPVERQRDRLKNEEIPKLQKEIREYESQLPSLTDVADKASNALKSVQKELKDINTLKQIGANVFRLHTDVKRLEGEIRDLESELAVAGGSTKSSTEVQEEIDEKKAEHTTVSKEKKNLEEEHNRKQNVALKYKNDWQDLRLRLSEKQGELKDKAAWQKSIEDKRKETEILMAEIKESDMKISESTAPIQILEQQWQDTQRDIHERLEKVQNEAQKVNRSVDKLFEISKAIEKYVRNKQARRLQECEDKIEAQEAEISQLSLSEERIRDSIVAIEQELNEAGTRLVHLRENKRIRKLRTEIAEVQSNIDAVDMEEAARAKRNFEGKWDIEKRKEENAANKAAALGGQIEAAKGQADELQGDLKEYKEINQRYTDQLIKVKLADMANADLEKYAKALDNAIMKYHSMKMEEVNDIMRHLWNKTYQGTDIDGIKIRSDSEGGASKRSYNYRVVMTKDQVEMDMRGRCSAGQKMLASIIIRLALSDSFGQNCGILALDEPTNALDTENIDALASSLVDIINERKNHANFQLIIITHDENFLRKLGQADVMEYYWRVSRDNRQKSVIERQRFI